MDEQSIFDILECSVCLERLDPTSRVLPCQHTFCMRCLQQILNVRKEIRCPECRDLAPHRSVTDLPTNILLVRLLDGMKRPTLSPKALGSSSTSAGIPGGQSSGSSGAGEGGNKSASSKVTGQNAACARALFKYEAQEPSDLSFNKGAIVTLLKRIDDNWYHGELDGSTGFLPASYVEVIVPLPPDPPQCKALYDFDVNEQEEKDCLTFAKDEVLNVIRRVDENWIEGQKGDKIGIFPISFVELNDTAKNLVVAHSGGASGDSSRPSGSGGEGASSGGDATQMGSGSQESSSSKNKSSNKRHSFTSMLGVQLRSKDSQDRSGSGNASGSGAGSSGSPSNRHSMEISSPVLLRSSNPTAATLIDANKAAAVGVIATGSSPSPASSPSPSTSPSPVAVGGAVSSTSTQSGGGRKKPAPLTLLNQSGASGGLPPNSPSMVGAAAPGTPTQLASQEPPSSPKPRVEVYVALFNYKPLNSDEVELKKGEFYTVTEKCKDGWYKGMSLVSGQIGVFPGNYMQPYRPDKQKKTGSSSTSSSSSSAASSQSSTAAASRTSNSSSQPGATSSSSSSTTTSSASGGAAVSSSAGGEKKPFIMQTEGQKTVAQLQSERAAQQLQYRMSGTPGSTLGGGAVSRPMQAPQGSRFGDRAHPRGSPPGVGVDIGSGGGRHGGLAGNAVTVAGSWPGNTSPIHQQQQVSNASRLGQQQVHAGSQTTNAATSSQISVQTVRPRTTITNPVVAHPYPSQHPPSSPPVSHHGSTTRTHSVPVASGVADSSTVQPGVPIRQACSQMAPSSYQKEKKERKGKKSSAASKHGSSSEAPELGGAGRTASPSHQPPSITRASPSPSFVSHSPGSSSKSPSPETHQQEGGVQGADVATMATASASSSGATVLSEEVGARGGSDRAEPTASGTTAEPSPPKTTPLLRERYRVLVPYPPTTDAELELKIGDTVFVHKKREDGWFKGTLHRTGKTGLFPGSFVEPF